VVTARVKFLSQTRVIRVKDFCLTLLPVARGKGHGFLEMAVYSLIQTIESTAVGRGTVDRQTGIVLENRECAEGVGHEMLSWPRQYPRRCTLEVVGMQSKRPEALWKAIAGVVAD